MLQIITSHEELKDLLFEHMLWAFENLPKRESPPPLEILTGEQLSQKLGVTIQTLINWRKKGKLPYMQIGSSVRYDLHKVLEALERKAR